VLWKGSPALHRPEKRRGWKGLSFRYGSDDTAERTRHPSTANKRPWPLFCLGRDSRVAGQSRRRTIDAGLTWCPMRPPRNVTRCKKSNPRRPTVVRRTPLTLVRAAQEPPGRTAIQKPKAVLGCLTRTRHGIIYPIGPVACRRSLRRPPRDHDPLRIVPMKCRRQHLIYSRVVELY